MSNPGDILDLTNQVAVVTGAGSGIGQASAQLLADAGATVICADIDVTSAGRTANAIADAGGSAQPVALDVTSREEFERVVANARAEHGRLDVMANIAGIIATNRILDTPEDEFDRVLATNLKGVFLGCQAAARFMTEQGSGSIINMSSGAIDTPREGLVSYAVAKAGVAQLTKTLAVEVGPYGVRANAIAPGFILTPMTSRHFTAPDGTVNEELKEATIAPMRDVQVLQKTGAPSDIAYAVLYLASDASSFMTGQILRPNGGVSMPW
jgi:3-oxoacyl-[acyl-carrier protein] reductase